MPELTIEIDLAASPERVWSVLTDFSKYPSWNPYQTIEGNAEPLAVVVVSSRRLDGHALPTARAAIWKFEPHTRLEFLSGTPLWFASTRFFHLSPSARGTLLKHGVRFSGIWAVWRFSHGHKIERLKPFYEAFGQAIVYQLAGRKPPKPFQNNRRSRRASKAKDH
jgi:hypothetical protein